MKEIADELKKCNIQITELQEVRWPQDDGLKSKTLHCYIVDQKPQRGNMVQGSLLQIVRHNAY
jgi:hypothetical protein